MLIPSLELGLEKMLRACTAAAEAGQCTDAIDYLATWLMRNNPMHNPEALVRLKAERAAAQQRAASDAARQLEIERRAQAAYEWQLAHDVPTLELRHEYGTVSLSIDLPTLNKIAEPPSESTV
eukprot:CAMPEP_0119390474 /NCGR_PEP_ID=MMETSP1334-20130426/113504_1 /TAXON_ID=127549 /ORGANISM="Calcidiscus leptoporus, Strain RCC1130" /LENGTH=122 /DNA_ID=CAMNT_0007412977 /DNA_START=128 /DNA_END=496 /DNA_ORIENTATION=+